MKLQHISGPPPPALAQALEAFESQFTYPLGPGKRFRITHGEDYTRFFRSMGDSACFIAERQGLVVGALGTAIRQLLMPDGTQGAVAYLGDLKIAPDARSGMVLLRLANAAEAWLRPRVASAFGVVMDGTAMTPTAYTGRAGIPGFREVGRLTVLRLSGRDEGFASDLDKFLTGQEDGLACYRRLSRGRYACPTGEAQQRSQFLPVWLMHPDGSACGMLEDTLKAKCLFDSDGQELLSMHLSCFACRTPSAGVELLRVALRHAARLTFPALFVAVAEPDAQAVRAALSCVEVLAAPATVYGTGLMPGNWNINSSEI